jgi:hypothetical protein
MWIEDRRVDLDHHVRRIVLPQPGTRAALEACVARLHGELLDRRRPLWMFYLIEGLAPGTSPGTQSASRRARWRGGRSAGERAPRSDTEAARACAAYVGAWRNAWLQLARGAAFGTPPRST